MLCVQQIVNFGGLKQSRARTLPYGRVILREQLRGEGGSIVSVCLNFVFRPPPRPAASALRRRIGTKASVRRPVPHVCRIAVCQWGAAVAEARGKEGINAQRTDQPKYSASTTSKTV